MLPPPSFVTITAAAIDGARLKKADPELEHEFFTICDDFWNQYANIKRDLRVAALNSAAESTRKQVRLVKQGARLFSYDDLLTETNQALQINSTI